MIRYVITAAVLVVGLGPLIGMAAGPNEWEIRFATEDEARMVLRRRDRFIQQLSPFDRQSRMGSSKPVSEEQLLEFISQQVRPWKPTEVNHIQEVVESVRQRLRPYAHTLPPKILAIKTSGKEEGGAAYCRGNAIILPESIAARPKSRLEGLLIHELFHVLSSHRPKLRKRLYASIGFQQTAPIPLPKTLRDLKITNPDGPGVDTIIRLTSSERKVVAAPVLIAREKYTGGTFFKYMQFRLMVVQPEGDRWIPATDESGNPRMLDPRKESSFLAKIGNNTNYIVHPDEILADNFVILSMRRKQIASPLIVQNLRRILTEARSEGE